MSKVKITLLIGCFASLIPAWIGSGLLPGLDPDQTIFQSSRGIIILVFFALSFWGTSFGYFYLKNFKYGFLSGLGKWSLIGLGILLHKTLQENSEEAHPYLIFLGILFAAIWGMVDFVLLYPNAKKTNLEA